MVSSLQDSWAIGSLLAAGDPGDWAALLDRMGDQLAPALMNAALPDACVDAVIATGRPAHLNAMARNPEVCRRPELLERLAGGDHPMEWWGYRSLAEPRLRRRLLATAQPANPAWTAREGLVPWLLSRTDAQELRPAVVCAFPDLVRHALVTLGPKLAPAEQLRGLLSLFAHAGPGAVLAAVHDAELSTDVIKLAREAAAVGDGESRLRAATQEAESTATLIDELYRVDSGRRRPRGGGAKGPLLSAADLINARTELDWPALLAAYTEKPFSKENTALALAKRSDCPEQMLAALLAAPPRVAGAGRWAQSIADAAVRRGLPGTRLLEVSRLAKGVLAVSWTAEDSSVWAQFHAALRVLVNDRLGTDVPAWRALRARLADHPGTVAELIDQALAAAALADGDDALLGEPWPDAAGVPDAHRTAGELPIVRAAFLALLEAAGAEAHIALLPHLDDRTAHDLVVSGSCRPELAEHILTEGSLRDVSLLSQRTDLTVDVIGRLLARNEPDINTNLFFPYKTTDRQRLRVVTGASAGAARTGRLALPPEIRDYMLGSGSGWTTGFALVCGDPAVARHVLHLVGVRPGLQRLRMFVGLWSRHGPDEVRALLAEDFSEVEGQRTKRFEPKLRTLLEGLLALPDEAAAFEQLRAHTLVALLREGPPVEDIVAVELPGWDWETVLEAHREKPFDPAAIRWLAGRPGCPAELTEGLEPLAEWVVRFQLTAAYESDSLDASGPAEPATAVASRRPGDWLWALAAQPVCTALPYTPPLAEWKRQAVADVLAPIKGSLEAWVLMLRMLPGFPGSLPELAATAERALR